MITEHHSGDVTWVDVVDPERDELARLAATYGLDEHAFDEASRRAARPMMRRYSDHAYIVAFTGHLAEIDMYIGEHWFITIRLHGPGGSEWDYADTLQRFGQLAGHHGSGMALALVLDDLVEEYFDTTDRLEDRLEAVEDRIFADTAPPQKNGIQHDLFGIRQELIQLRRAVIPLREVLSALLRKEVPWVSGEALTVCHDAFDKLLRAIDLVDELRELVGNAVDANLAVMSHQMNLVMKKLTAWGSILFVAALIAGIYGMNFRDMPELRWRLGYPFALGLMAVSSIVLYRVFKRRDWV